MLKNTYYAELVRSTLGNGKLTMGSTGRREAPGRQSRASPVAVPVNPNVRHFRMRLAHKIGLSLSLAHGIFFFWAAFGSGAGIILEIFFASIYIPLIPFHYMGLPVTDGFTGWGWVGPSSFGYVLAIVFWLGVWILVGHVIESTVKRIKNA